MELLDVLHQISCDSQRASQPTDLYIGTVTNVNPLEITIDTTAQPLKEPVLYLTDAVVEKKMTRLEHTHDTKHSHTLGLSTTSIDKTCSRELTHVVCVVHGKELPEKDGYIILNQALCVGDKVLLLRVQRGQKFVILSRVYGGG